MSILFSMPRELWLVKWLRFFDPNCIVKWVIFFSSFCWLCDFLLENLKLKKTSDYLSTNMKSCMPEIIFSKKKRIPNMLSWIIYILFQISLCRDCFRVFQPNFSLSANHSCRHLYSASPTIKKLLKALRQVKYLHVGN